MAGTVNINETLQRLFPHKTLPSVAHGTSKKAATKKLAHGRSRGHLPTAATRDPFHGKGRAAGQR